MLLYDFNLVSFSTSDYAEFTGSTSDYPTSDFTGSTSDNTASTEGKKCNDSDETATFPESKLIFEPPYFKVTDNSVSMDMFNNADQSIR